jgi:hypothetical protein
MLKSLWTRRLSFGISGAFKPKHQKRPSAAASEANASGALPAG